METISVIKLILMSLSFLNFCHGFDPDLPPEHLPFFFNQFPELRQNGEEKPKRCWGYENFCPNEYRYSNCSCPGNFEGWAPDEESAKNMFYTQADFGYLRERRKDLLSICTSKNPESSSLKCTKEFLSYISHH